MLEPYAVKAARTVLRRDRAGNRSILFDKGYTPRTAYPIKVDISMLKIICPE